MGFIRFAVKSSIAGGFVYYTIQEGLWSNADDSVRLYNKMYSNVAPLVKQNIPNEVIKEIPDLPSVRNMTNCAKVMWNNGVKISIKYISELPTHISNGIDSIMTMTSGKEAVTDIKSTSESAISK